MGVSEFVNFGGERDCSGKTEDEFIARTTTIGGIGDTDAVGAVWDKKARFVLGGPGDVAFVVFFTGVGDALTIEVGDVFDLTVEGDGRFGGSAGGGIGA